MTKEWNKDIEKKIARFIDYENAIGKEVTNPKHSAGGSICRIMFKNAAFRPTALYRSICSDLGLKPNTPQQVLDSGSLTDPNWHKISKMARQNGNDSLADKIDSCLKQEAKFKRAGWGNKNRSPLKVIQSLKTGK